MPITKRISPKVGDKVEILLPGDTWSICRVLRLDKVKQGFWIAHSNPAAPPLFYSYAENAWRWPHPTLQDLAKEALTVQGACNLSGIVHSFDRAMTNLRAALPDAGTDELNRHPITRAWIYKLANLAGLPEQQIATWHAVERLAAGEPV